MELLAYWKVIRRRLWLIVLLVLVSCAGAAFYSLRQVPEYSATTTLFLNTSVAKSVLGSLGTDALQSLANTYTEFMRTSSFAHRVVSELGVPMTEKELEEALSAKYVPDTQFFRITATHPDPKVAQALANTAAGVLIAENSVRQQAQREQLEAQRGSSRVQNRERLIEVQKALEDELASYNDQIKSLQAQIAELQQGAPSAENNQRIQNSRDELLKLKSARVDVLNSLVRAQSDLGGSSDDNISDNDTAVVVDVAPLPTVPISRGIIERTFLAMAVSLVAGLGLTFLLEYLNYTIKTSEELEAIYGMPAQGIIGSVSRKRGKDKRQADLITVSERYSPRAEAFRALRVGVQTAGLDSPVRSLLVTSAVPHEGKTFVAANLAASLAQNGCRVILVDADLRKPTLHQVFDLLREPGFTNAIFQQQVDLTTFLQQTSVKNLHVLTCGAIPPNPAELLGSQRVARMIAQLEEHADIVVYDSPPVVVATDAVVIAPWMDGVLQVVLAGGTRIDVVLRCKAILDHVRAHILGPVLNRVRSSDSGQYTSYRGYYSNAREAAEQPGLHTLAPQAQQSENGAATGSATDSEPGAKPDTPPTVSFPRRKPRRPYLNGIKSIPTDLTDDDRER
jgi:capsular exopolysaccharide synthesis family protein